MRLGLYLIAIQRPEGISPKMQCGTTERSEFLILRVYYISKISLSLGGKVSHPIKFEVCALFCFFFSKKENRNNL